MLNKTSMFLFKQKNSKKIRHFSYPKNWVFFQTTETQSQLKIIVDKKNEKSILKLELSTSTRYRWFKKIFLPSSVF